MKQSPGQREEHMWTLLLSVLSPGAAAKSWPFSRRASAGPTPMHPAGH